MKNFLKWIKVECAFLMPAFLCLLFIIALYWFPLERWSAGITITLKDGSVTIECNEGPLVECSKQDILIHYSDD